MTTPKTKLTKQAVLAESPMETILEAVASAVAEWKQKLSPEKIRQQTFDRLNSESETITMKLLGFDNRWDKKWSLDHCNGRSGESAAGDYFRTAQAAAIKEWLSTVTLDPLSAAENKALAAAFNKTYREQLREHVRALAYKQAEQDAKSFIEELTNHSTVDQYIKTLALLNPTGSTSGEHGLL